MSIATKIPMSEWLAAGDAAIATAIDVLEDKAEQIQRRTRR